MCRWNASGGTVRPAGPSFSPLDVKLGLSSETYSPSVLEKIVRQGGNEGSFRKASENLHDLAGVKISAKNIERLTCKIGREWADARDREIEKFRKNELPPDRVQPATAPVAAVMIDGGRVLTRADTGEPGVHEPQWKETKVACVQTMTSVVSPFDPQPEPPSKYLQEDKVKKLVADIKRRSGTGGRSTENRPAPKKKKRRRPCKDDPARPKKLVRTVVASMAQACVFGWHVAVEVFRRGLESVARKACVCDGQHSNWSIFEMHLEPAGFVGITDFLHLLTYLYSAAQAVGEDALQRWTLYQQWVRWAWKGEADRVLGALQQASERLGPPPKDASDSDPRKAAAEATTYVRNNRRRMDYAKYRKLGLPISSAAVESTIKQINMRIKGTEKFWLIDGTEEVLQVRAACLSEDEREQRCWSRPRRYRAACGRPKAA